MTDDGGRSPGGSTVTASEMDDHTVAYPSSPIRADPHRHHNAHEHPDDEEQDASKSGEAAEQDEVRTPGGTAPPGPTSSTSRKKKEKDPAPAAGPNSSIYSGNKVRHLKKDDGEPLWRADIQYDFLKCIFDDTKAVFTSSYEPEGPRMTFANLYIDSMARSSKTSKILRDKLLSEHEPAKNMAMVCLLVNLGRMNTTLNCKYLESWFTAKLTIAVFPEMRAQLRTYHAIPSLQAHQDPNSYKQLQDAPRLKSILKGASEDRVEPNTLEKIKAIDEAPRTNPVNLIFVLAQFAPKMTQMHLPPGHDFYDLIMRTNLSSKSRATAFLWLMWFYLESDFTEEGADENPFGPGVDYGVRVRNQGVPRFEYLDEEEEALENVDTQEEKDYGLSKMRERKRIIEADQAAFQAENGPPKRGPKPRLHLPGDERGNSPAALLGRIRPKFDELSASSASMMGRIRPKYESDMDSTRSTPPPRLLGPGFRGLGMGKGRMKHAIDGSSPVPGSEPTMTRARPLTAHQLAVERNRNQRVDHILGRGLRRVHHQARKARKQEGALYRALERTKSAKDIFDDSEDEEGFAKDPGHFRSRGFGGLVQREEEDDDYGEEMSAYAAAFRRTGRRLDRWDKDTKKSVVGTNRAAPLQPIAVNGNGTQQANDDTEDETQTPARRANKKDVNGDVNMEDEELDEVEKEVLGLGSGDEDDAGAEDLDDVDKELLGIAGDDTEDDASDGGMDVDG